MTKQVTHGGTEGKKEMPALFGEENTLEKRKSEQENYPTTKQNYKSRVKTGVSQFSGHMLPWTLLGNNSDTKAFAICQALSTHTKYHVMYLIFTTSLEDSCYSYLNFINEETEAQRW